MEGPRPVRPPGCPRPRRTFRCGREGHRAAEARSRRTGRSGPSPDRSRHGARGARRRREVSRARASCGSAPGACARTGPPRCPAVADDPSAAEAVARGQAADAALGAREQAWRDARVAESDEQRRRAQQALQRLIDLGKAETPTLKSLDRAISEGIAAETALEAEHGDAARDELLAKLQAARDGVAAEGAGPARGGRLAALGECRRAGAAHRRDGEARHRGRCRWPRFAGCASSASSGRPSRRRRAIAPRRSGTGSVPPPKPSARTSSRCAPSAPPSRPSTSRARSRSASAPKRCAESTDWIATADALKALQAEWKTVGPAPRRDEQAVWERFRAACNAFFTRRQDDLKRRKDEWTVNLEKKEALIVRADALVESTRSREGVRRAEGPAGGVEDDRSCPQVEVRTGLAALPHGGRQGLRSLSQS